MLGTALSVVGLMALGWLVLVGLLALQERRLIFFPTRSLAAAAPPMSGSGPRSCRSRQPTA